MYLCKWPLAALEAGEIQNSGSYIKIDLSESLWLKFGQYSYVVKLTYFCTPVAAGVTLIPRKYTPVILETAGEINKYNITKVSSLPDQNSTTPLF